MNGKLIAYRAVTGLFGVALAGSGVGDLMHAPAIAEGLHHLGYPPYLMTILGVWKLLGVVALVTPGHARLKEWAYAGFAFHLSGAFVSHLMGGDPFSAAVPSLVLFALGAASWRLRDLVAAASGGQPASRAPVGLQPERA